MSWVEKAEAPASLCKHLPFWVHEERGEKKKSIQFKTFAVNRDSPGIELVNDGLESDDGKEPRREAHDPGQRQHHEDDERHGAPGV